MTAIAPAPVDTTTSNSELGHIYCCNPDLALCGTDISDMAEIDAEEEVDCIVCNDLEAHPCPTCAN
ncbi:hypothetical protein AB0L71_28210 [Streptomyces sp. NPDC052052]|uniref:hypothetical protein n=1 Tax=Streptomyces sp. NPDC052052 TaxID=3154756 RepID=UPI00341301C1